MRRAGRSRERNRCREDIADCQSRIDEAQVQRHWMPSNRVIVRPLSCGEQVSRRSRDQIDQLAVERFRLGERLRVGHGGFRELHVPPRSADVAAQVRRRIVQNFLASAFRPPASASTPLARSGEAAPVSVPGAIAAMSAESKIKKPAEAACEPLGVT